MKHPIPDPRDPEVIRAEIAALAASYTPEWRYESAADDPGAAMAELFARMFEQTVDRFNALPEKYFVEFLNQIGFKEPVPMPAKGTLCLNPHDEMDEPVSVPAGTQVFTPDEDGSNVVFETERSIQITSADLDSVYFVSAGEDSICRLDFSEQAPRLFTRTGMELQEHLFSLSENRVLCLNGPARITLGLHQEISYMDEESARRLVQPGMQWTFLHDGAQVPFDQVRAEGGRVILEKQNNLSMDADEDGRVCITCTGRTGLVLNLDRVTISSEPLEDCPADSICFRDMPIDLSEGGYCFGQDPMPYDLFYMRCDPALSKPGADVLLTMDIHPLIREPEAQGPVYDFTKPIIDKQAAAVRRPDDSYVNQVVWEYYNGIGWHYLQVEGDKNPFSCKREGEAQLRFTVPEDTARTLVNAEEGYFLRARVTEVVQQFSTYRRIIAPLITKAAFRWHYDQPVRANWLYSRNNGQTRILESADQPDHLSFKAFDFLEPAPDTMYFCFTRSPHAMPLSLNFRMQGRTRMEGQLLWEAWNGKVFEPVRSVDQTNCLLHTGEMFLFLPDPLPEADFFGTSGYWLRMCRSDTGERTMPTAASIRLNTVSARQRQQEPDQYFDTGIYEAGKQLQLLAQPVLDCTVWIDEISGISDAEIRMLERECPEKVRLEREHHIPQHCWVCWDQVEDIAMAGPNDRVFMLEPYLGRVIFGDGRQGKVPPSGDHNIVVHYASGGGQRGNVPAGAVNSLLMALPEVSDLSNLTAMSGGTGRPDMDAVERLGRRFLRSWGRAAGRSDYEDLIRQSFPQVCHVRCFSGQNERGEYMPGHVTVVLSGFGRAGEGTQALCDEVFQFLKERSSCCLTAENRLHVRPATVMTVNTQVSLKTVHPELSADTQQELVQAIDALITQIWKKRSIGEQIRLDEIWTTVRDHDNVRLIERILVEGSYDDEGQEKLVPLENDDAFAYSVVESGTHRIRLS